MNNFQTIESGKGILKNDYQDTVSEALKRKRKSLKDSKLGISEEDVDNRTQKELGEEND